MQKQFVRLFAHDSAVQLALLCERERCWRGGAASVHVAEREPVASAGMAIIAKLPAAHRDERDNIISVCRPLCFVQFAKQIELRTSGLEPADVQKGRIAFARTASR